jgi:hypothetical protein
MPPRCQRKHERKKHDYYQPFLIHACASTISVPNKNKIGSSNTYQGAIFYCAENQSFTKLKSRVKMDCFTRFLPDFFNLQKEKPP